MLDAGLSEIARFLALRPPIDTLAPEELGDVAAQTQIEFHPPGAVILSEDGGPVTFLRVIHSGAVDIWHEGKLLDLLGPGDTFGHAPMLAGLPACSRGGACGCPARPTQRCSAASGCRGAMARRRRGSRSRASPSCSGFRRSHRIMPSAMR